MDTTVRTRYVPSNIVTPLATTIAAPRTTVVNLGQVALLGVHLRIPAGHAGLTGIRIDYSGVTILPWSNPSAWLIGDDDKLDFDIDMQVGNTLSVVTYNTDVYAHTHYLLWKVSDLLVDTTAPLQLVDIRP